MATLRQAIDIAKKEPNSERSQKLKAAIIAGKMDSVAEKEGINLDPFKSVVKKRATPGSIAEKLISSIAPGAVNTAKQFADTGKQVLKQTGEAVMKNPDAVMEKYENFKEVDKAKKNVVLSPGERMEDISDEEIIQKSEDQEGARESVTGQVARGLGSSLSKTVSGISSLTRKGAETVTGKDIEPGVIEETFREGVENVDKNQTGIESLTEIAGDIAQFFIPGGAAAKGAKALQRTKLMSKAPALVRNTAPIALTEGLGAAGVTAAQTGDIGTEEVYAGLLGAVFPAIGGTWKTFKGADELLSKAPNPKAVKEARRAGVSEADINTILNLSDDQKEIAKGFLEASKKKATEKISQTGKVNKGAFGQVGKELDSFVDEAAGLKKSIGKELGDEAAKLKGTTKIDLSPSKKALQDVLGESGIKVSSKGKLNFKGTRYEGLAGDQKIIQDAWNFANKNKNADPFVVLEKVRNLDVKVGAGKTKMDIGPAERIVNIYRSSLDDSVTNLSPKLKELKSQYAQISNALKKVRKLIGKEGEKSEDVARRLFGNASGKTEDVFNAINDLVENFSMKSGKGLLNKSAIADVTDSAAGAISSRSFAGGVKEGAEAATKAATGNGLGDLVLIPLRKIAEKIYPKLDKDEAVEMLLKAEVQNGMSFLDVLKSLSTRVAGKTGAAIGGLQEQ
jgi:ElaB/YqjD/DUF883 family membrane-anchored ribosome-binding protein